MKISFICTVLNEEKTIEELLISLTTQTIQPDEIIIVDGGSVDATKLVISKFKIQNSKFSRIKLIMKKGNRSIGRNEAIKNATGDIIVISDSGCVLDKNWICEIVKPFQDSKVDVVSGYYEGKGGTVLQRCIAPFFLVMPDHIDPNLFLPATRSMAIRKKTFEKMGGFNEKLSLNEDYEFAKRLQKEQIKISFTKKAIVFWIPPDSFASFYKTIYTFARGDIQAKILRPKVIILFSRYLVLFQLLIMIAATREFIIIAFFVAVAFLYVFFSIVKNYKYVKNVLAVVYLPLLQFISDFAVIGGTIKGGQDLWVTRNQS